MISRHRIEDIRLGILGRLPKLARLNEAGSASRLSTLYRIMSCQTL